MFSILVRIRALFDNWNADTGRQFSDRRWKIEMLVVHHKTENTSPDPAAEAVKRLPLRADREGGRLFPMKGAERFEVRSGAFEWKIRSDHFDDVIRRRDLFDIL
jgi:hypothetical protein